MPARRNDATSFIADLSRFQRRLGDVSDRFVQALFFELGRNIVVGGDYSPGTPVRTGYARGSWWVSLGSTGGGPVGDRRTISPLAVSQLTIVNLRAGVVAYWLNNAEYIRELEYNHHSQQAPDGFVRVTVANYRQIVTRVLRQFEVASY